MPDAQKTPTELQPPPVPEKVRQRAGEGAALRRRAEATGLILVALIMLLVILLRYGRYIPWGAR